MNEKLLYTTLLAPYTTEKSTRIGAKGQMIFRVAKEATKTNIARVIEKLFSVKVQSVNIVNSKGKRKQHRQMAGTRRDSKKAYISLAEGHEINLANWK